MPTLVITKQYSDGNILTEAMLDAIKASIENFLNTIELDSQNIQTGGVSTANLANNAVTDAKFRQAAGTSVVGRASGTLGNTADIAASADNTILKRVAGALTFATLAAADIASNLITYAKLQQSSAGTTVLGVTGGSPANYAEITASSDGTVLKRSSGALTFASVATADIASGAVTQAKLGASQIFTSSTVSGSDNSAAYVSVVSFTPGYTFTGNRAVHVMMQSTTEGGSFGVAEVGGAAADIGFYWQLKIDGTVFSTGFEDFSDGSVPIAKNVSPSAIQGYLVPSASTHTFSLEIKSHGVVSNAVWSNVCMKVVEL